MVNAVASAERGLAISNVAFRYRADDGRAFWVLRKFSLNVRQGAVIAIVGPSGCGKTTLLNVVSGLLRPEEGVVTLRGENVVGEPRAFAYMFQRDSLLPWRTVEANVSLPLEVAGCAKRQARELAKVAMEQVGVTSLAAAAPHTLSGGQRQRVALARTFLLDRKCYLFDEPFNSLDVSAQLALEDQTWRLLREREAASLFVTHDIESAMAIGDEVVVVVGTPLRIVARVPATGSRMPDERPSVRRGKVDGRHYSELMAAVRDMAESDRDRGV